MPKKEKDQTGLDFQTLLAGDMDLEKQQTIETVAQNQIGGKAGKTDQEDDDDVEGWINEMLLLYPSEHTQVKEDICPVKLVLVKVRYQ